MLKTKKKLIKKIKRIHLYSFMIETADMTVAKKNNIRTISTKLILS